MKFHFFDFGRIGQDQVTNPNAVSKREIEFGLLLTRKLCQLHFSNHNINECSLLNSASSRLLINTSIVSSRLLIDICIVRRSNHTTHDTKTIGIVFSRLLIGIRIVRRSNHATHDTKTIGIVFSRLLIDIRIVRRSNHTSHDTKTIGIVFSRLLIDIRIV